MRSERWAPVVCAVIPVIAVLATVPVGETGLNDDWSYARTALDAARSGKLIYNGWATTMVGVQAYWGALWIKIFGFSFITLRLSVLPLAAGCGYLIWWLGRRCGSSDGAAMFASLAVTTSPLFVPLAASFMTDVPGLFFLLLTAALYVKACEGGCGAVGWIVLGTVAGVLGGTIRQVIWWMPLAGLIYVAWMGRRRAGVIGVCAWMWAVSVIAAIALNGWFARQPLYVPDQAGGRLQWMMSHLPHSLIDSVLLGLTLVMLLLPILAMVLPVSCNRLSRIMLCIAIGAAIMALLWLILGQRVYGPWLGNMITVWGVTGTEQVAIGFKPVILPMWVRVGLTVAVAFALAQLATLAWQVPLQLRRRQQDQSSAHQTSSPPHALRLLGVFLFGYVPLLIVQAGVGTAIDRYLLPILPVCTIGLLYYAEKHGMKLRWSAGAMVMSVFALYAIATTHDFIAEARARASAAQRVIESGVARRHVTAGFEFDAWTQLETRGHVNDPRLVNPPGTFVKAPQWAQQGATPWFWYWRWTPVLEPRYFIVRAPQEGLVNSGLAPVIYWCWLPPFRRQVWIQQRPEQP